MSWLSKLGLGKLAKVKLPDDLNSVKDAAYQLERYEKLWPYYMEIITAAKAVYHDRDSISKWAALKDALEAIGVKL